MAPLDEEPDDLFDETGDELVPAVYARSLDEAEEFQQLLEDHDIEASVGSEDETPEVSERLGRGVPVLVPEALLDEASEIIADHEDSDEFSTEDDEDFEDDEDDEDELDLEPDAEGEMLLEGDEDDEDDLDDEDEQY